MFEAWVLVCLLSNPQHCFEAQDKRGPYETRQECYDRTIEMRESIRLLPDHNPQSYKCLELKREGLQT